MVASGEEAVKTLHNKTFDLIFTAGHAAGTRNVGIYRLLGDQWTLCLSTSGGKRPRTFVAKPGTGFVLESLVRAVPGRTR